MADITIQQGDTLSGIAAAQNTTVDALMQANPNITNPNLIISGESLNLPDAPTSPAGATTGLGDITEPIGDEIQPADGVTQTIRGGGFSRAKELLDSQANIAVTSIEQAILDIKNEREQEILGQKDIQQQEAEAARLGLESAISPEESRIDLMQRLRREAGIKEKESSLNDILSQINQVRASYEQGRIGLVDESSTMKLLRGKQARLQEQANAKISALAAAGQLVQGQLNSAQQLVSDYYTATIADREDEIARRKMLYELENNDVIKLTDEEKELNDQSIAFLEGINQRQLQEKDRVTDLMLNNPRAWQNASGEIDLNQPFNKIVEQLLPYIAAEERRMETLRATGTGTTRTFITQEEKDIYDMAYNLVQTEQSGRITPEQWSGFVNQVVKATGMTYEQAENRLIRDMQEIQSDLGVAGKPYYGGAEENLGSGIIKTIPNNYISSTPSLLLDTKKQEPRAIKELRFEP